LRNISDTIARLSALRARHSAHVPNHGRQDRLQDLTDFGSNPGSLKGRFHLPPSLPKNAPLVVVLHGCTQNPAGYDHHSGWSQLADEAGFALLFPEQQRANNPNLCFNWFEPADTGRDGGEALSIRQMIEYVCVRHRIDRSRIFIAGLSAGGGMTSALVANYPAVARLVGDVWFRAATAAFVRQGPPQHPMLVDYGAAFPDFLRTFEPAAELPYLPDVALLDRYWTEAYIAADTIRRVFSYSRHASAATMEKSTLTRWPCARARCSARRSIPS